MVLWMDEHLLAHRQCFLDGNYMGILLQSQLGVAFFNLFSDKLEFVCRKLYAPKVEERRLYDPAFSRFVCGRK